MIVFDTRVLSAGLRLTLFKNLLGIGIETQSLSDHAPTVSGGQGTQSDFRMMRATRMVAEGLNTNMTQTSLLGGKMTTRMMIDATP